MNSDGLEPGDGAFDGGDDLRRGLLDLHQEADDADAFAAGERGRLEVPRPGGLERRFVMLGAPGGELAVLLDLGAQDAVDAPGHGGAGPGAAGRIHEVEGRLAGGGVAQDGQYIDHRVVVIRDVRVVAFAEREILRPAAVLILGGEQVVDPALESLRGSGCARCLHHQGKIRIGVVVAPLSMVLAPPRSNVSARASGEGGGAARSVFLGQPPWGDCHLMTMSAI